MIGMTMLLPSSRAQWQHSYSRGPSHPLPSQSQPQRLYRPLQLPYPNLQAPRPPIQPHPQQSNQPHSQPHRPGPLKVSQSLRPHLPSPKLKPPPPPLPGHHQPNQPPLPGQYKPNQPLLPGQHQPNQPPLPGQHQPNQPPLPGHHQPNQPPLPGHHQLNQPPLPGHHQPNQPPLPGQHQPNQPPLPGQHQPNQPPLPGQHQPNQPPLPGHQPYQPPLPGQHQPKQPPQPQGHHQPNQPPPPPPPSQGQHKPDQPPPPQSTHTHNRRYQVSNNQQPLPIVKSQYPRPYQYPRPKPYSQQQPQLQQQPPPQLQKRPSPQLQQQLPHSQHQPQLQQRPPPQPPHSQHQPQLQQRPPPQLQQRPPPQLQQRLPPQLQQRPPPQLQQRPPPQLQQQTPPHLQQRPPPQLQKQTPPQLQQRPPPQLQQRPPPQLQQRPPPQLQQRPPPQLQQRPPPPQLQQRAPPQLQQPPQNQHQPHLLSQHPHQSSNQYYHPQQASQNQPQQSPQTLQPPPLHSSKYHTQQNPQSSQQLSLYQPQQLSHHPQHNPQLTKVQPQSSQQPILYQPQQPSQAKHPGWSQHSPMKNSGSQQHQANRYPNTRQSAHQGIEGQQRLDTHLSSPRQSDAPTASPVQVISDLAPVTSTITPTVTLTPAPSPISTITILPLNHYEESSNSSIKALPPILSLTQAASSIPFNTPVTVTLVSTTLAPSPVSVRRPLSTTTFITHPGQISTFKDHDLSISVLADSVTEKPFTQYHTIQHPVITETLSALPFNSLNSGTNISAVTIKSNRDAISEADKVTPVSNSDSIYENSDTSDAGSQGEWKSPDSTTQKTLDQSFSHSTTPTPILPQINMKPVHIIVKTTQLPSLYSQSNDNKTEKVSTELRYGNEDKWIWGTDWSHKSPSAAPNNFESEALHNTGVTSYLLTTEPPQPPVDIHGDAYIDRGKNVYTQPSHTEERTDENVVLPMPQTHGIRQTDILRSSTLPRTEPTNTPANKFHSHVPPTSLLTNNRQAPIVNNQSQQKHQPPAPPLTTNKTPNTQHSSITRPRKTLVPRPTRPHRRPSYYRKPNITTSFPSRPLRPLRRPLRRPFSRYRPHRPAQTSPSSSSRFQVLRPHLRKRPSKGVLPQFRPTSGLTFPLPTTEQDNMTGNDKFDTGSDNTSSQDSKFGYLDADQLIKNGLRAAVQIGDDNPTTRSVQNQQSQIPLQIQQEIPNEKIDNSTPNTVTNHDSGDDGESALQHYSLNDSKDLPVSTQTPTSSTSLFTEKVELTQTTSAWRPFQISAGRTRNRGETGSKSLSPNIQEQTTENIINYPSPQEDEYPYSTTTYPSYLLSTLQEDKDRDETIVSYTTGEYDIANDSASDHMDKNTKAIGMKNEATIREDESSSLSLLSLFSLAIPTRNLITPSVKTQDINMKSDYQVSSQAPILHKQFANDNDYKQILLDTQSQNQSVTRYDLNQESYTQGSIQRQHSAQTTTTYSNPWIPILREITEMPHSSSLNNGTLKQSLPYYFVDTEKASRGTSTSHDLIMSQSLENSTISYLPKASAEPTIGEDELEQSTSEPLLKDDSFTQHTLLATTTEDGHNDGTLDRDLAFADSVVYEDKYKDTQFIPYPVMHNSAEGLINYSNGQISLTPHSVQIDENNNKASKRDTPLNAFSSMHEFTDGTHSTLAYSNGQTSDVSQSNKHQPLESDFNPTHDSISNYNSFHQTVQYGIKVPAQFQPNYNSTKVGSNPTSTPRTTMTHQSSLFGSKIPAQSQSLGGTVTLTNLRGETIPLAVQEEYPAIPIVSKKPEKTQHNLVTQITEKIISSTQILPSTTEEITAIPTEISTPNTSVRPVVKPIRKSPTVISQTTGNPRVRHRVPITRRRKYNTGPQLSGTLPPFLHQAVMVDRSDSDSHRNIAIDTGYGNVAYQQRGVIFINGKRQ
ncbi:hypothetical protein Pmani_006847 [Petrolisthes manimaculis]|uniref:Uncharacterized protein n=1 Tax=Petrolisthes manimaculis TaxID=1843537 RepID=A0AAE1Q9H9_9EUCA|nr:hypothetical protein Pmani_006847 [Petrolisthes manimaculis]